MQRRFLLQAGLGALVLPGWMTPAAAGTAVLVVGSQGLARIDAPTVQRLYTGRAIEIAGTLVTVANLRAGHALRAQFLDQWLQTDEERYRAYWTVRRHIGKGVPPREFASVTEVLDFVQRTPGGVGYVDAESIRSGVNVIARA